MQVIKFEPENFDIKFVPNLPPIEKPQYGLMGRLVSGIRSAAAKGVIQRVIIHAALFFVSVALWISIVGTPLFVWGFREFTQQEERADYNARYQKLFNMAFQHAKGKFLEGRWGPLENLDIQLNKATRESMIDFLDIRDEKSTIHRKDIDLLKLVAEKDPDFLRRYKMINSRF